MEHNLCRSGDVHPLSRFSARDFLVLGVTIIITLGAIEFGLRSFFPAQVVTIGRTTPENRLDAGHRGDKQEVHKDPDRCQSDGRDGNRGERYGDNTTEPAPTI